MTDTPMDPNEAAARAVAHAGTCDTYPPCPDEPCICKRLAESAVRARDKALAGNLPAGPVELACRILWTTGSWEALSEPTKQFRRQIVKEALSAAFQALGEGGG